MAERSTGVGHGEKARGLFIRALTETASRGRARIEGEDDFGKTLASRQQA